MIYVFVMSKFTFMQHEEDKGFGFGSKKKKQKLYMPNANDRWHIKNNVGLNFVLHTGVVRLYIFLCFFLFFSLMVKTYKNQITFFCFFNAREKYLFLSISFVGFCDVITFFFIWFLMMSKNSREKILLKPSCFSSC